MKVFLSTALLSLAMTLCTATFVQAQQTIADCEKIQAADAYNQCLAKFGPPAKTLNMEGQRPGDVKSSADEAAQGGGKPSLGRGTRFGRHHGRGKAVYRRGRGSSAGRGSRSRHGGGRKRMSISVGK